MISPQKILCAVALWLLISGALAAPASAQLAGIHSGSWQIGGGFAGGYDSATGLDIDIYPFVRYFIGPRTGLGLQLRYKDTDSLTHFGYGPTIQYFFVKDHPWAAYVGMDMMFWETDYDAGWTDSGTNVTLNVGVQYFVAPRTALGISMNYDIFDAMDDNSRHAIRLRGHIAAYF